MRLEVSGAWTRFGRSRRLAAAPSAPGLTGSTPKCCGEVKGAPNEGGAEEPREEGEGDRGGEGGSVLISVGRPALRPPLGRTRSRFLRRFSWPSIATRGGADLTDGGTAGAPPAAVGAGADVGDAGKGSNMAPRPRQ